MDSELAGGLADGEAIDVNTFHSGVVSRLNYTPIMEGFVNCCLKCAGEGSRFKLMRATHYCLRAIFIMCRFVSRHFSPLALTNSGVYGLGLLALHLGTQGAHFTLLMPCIFRCRPLRVSTVCPSVTTGQGVMRFLPSSYLCLPFLFTPRTAKTAIAHIGGTSFIVLRVWVSTNSGMTASQRGAQSGLGGVPC